MFSFSEIAEVVGGELLRAREGAPRGISHDSRSVSRGDLFVALPGRHTDGHAYLDEAMAAGATGAIVTDPRRAPARARNLIVVPDTLLALHDLAAAWRSMLGASIVAVTGSNGKTTTKALLAHLLAGDRAVYASPANYNTEIGVPLSLLSMSATCDVGVFELGSEAPGEIGALARLLRPAHAVITSVGPSHLATMGSIEAVAEEKWSLVEAIPPAGWAVVNADVAQLRTRAARPGFRGVTAGFDHGEIRGLAHEVVPRLKLSVEPLDLLVEAPLLGIHNASNLLLACVCAHRLGVPSSWIERRAASFVGADHRLVLREAPFGRILDDTYNANPASTEAALRVLAELGGNATRTVFVFGAMSDLGPHSAAGHAGVIEAARRLGIDWILPVGHEAAAACAAAGIACQTPNGIGELGRWLRRELAGRDSLVLVKGSRILGLERLVEALASSEQSTSESADQRT